uniref:Uncharacterized protein n=1 Tax=Rhizophora mucronata TaxID=61149 RepID=A0A2P2QQ43_RHIMU
MVSLFEFCVVHFRLFREKMKRKADSLWGILPSV